MERGKGISCVAIGRRAGLRLPHRNTGRPPKKKPALARAGFCVAVVRQRYIDSTHFTSVAVSSGEDFTLAWPLPAVSSSVSLACASALPLYLAAMSLNDGPTFLVSAAWHPMQPDFCAS